MPILSASLDAFVVTSIAVAWPTYYFLRRRQSKSQAPFQDVLTILVTLHTIYMIYVLTVLWPPNLFQRLNIPITMPADRIRTILLQKAGLSADARLPQPLEALITRLSSYETRALYVRFGQSVLQDCEHCKTVDQYAFYALPGPLLEYIREAALLGFVTVHGSHRARWRTPALVVLVAACLFECYTVAAFQFSIPRDGRITIWLHDTAWLFRNIFFLILPILVHILPPKPPADPIASVLDVKNRLEAASKRVTTYKYVHGAVMREPSLRESASEWWGKQWQVGKWAREDPAVQTTAAKLGTGFVGGPDETVANRHVKMAVEQLKEGIVPPK